MAIIRTASIVAAISGSIGGATFVQAKTGLVARTRSYHRPNHSAALLQQQSNFANTIRRWRSLSTEQRLSWRSFASTFKTTNRLGVDGNHSGFNAFTQRNLLGLAWADRTFDTPFTVLLSGDITQLFASFTVGGPYNVSWFGNPGPAGITAKIDGTPHNSTVVPKFSGQLRQIHIEIDINPIAQTVDIQPAWDAIFGLLQLGQAFSIAMSIWNLDAGGFPSTTLEIAGTVRP